MYILSWFIHVLKYLYYAMHFINYIQSQLKKQLPNDDPTTVDWHGHKYVADNVDKKNSSHQNSELTTLG